MGKRVQLVPEFKVVYVPLPLKMVEARRASLLLLLRWIREARNKEELPRVTAYVLGVLGMMVPFTAWLQVNTATVRLLEK